MTQKSNSLLLRWRGRSNMRFTYRREENSSIVFVYDKEGSLITWFDMYNPWGENRELK